MVVDYFKRLLIAIVIAMCIGILFVGGTATFASVKNIDESLIHSLIWPTEGIITDTYGTRWGNHFGIDIAAPVATPVVAVADGQVSKSYSSSSYGNVIFIEHDNGLETVYAHLHERYIAENEYVSQGQKIGTVGNTGRSFGDHLHFEVHLGNWNVEKSNSIDPFLVLETGQPLLVKEEEDDEQMEEDLFKEVLSTRYYLERERNREENSHPRKTIVVTKGDTLWEIAKKNKVTVDDLKYWNNLEDDMLLINQVLHIFEYEYETHYVEPGDSLISIANTYDKTVEEVIELNSLKSEQIYAGDVLIVE